MDGDARGGGREEVELVCGREEGGAVVRPADMVVEPGGGCSGSCAGSWRRLEGRPATTSTPGTGPRRQYSTVQARCSYSELLQPAAPRLPGGAGRSDVCPPLSLLAPLPGTLSGGGRELEAKQPDSGPARETSPARGQGVTSTTEALLVSECLLLLA
jgi:hypothetical protein